MSNPHRAQFRLALSGVFISKTCENHRECSVLYRSRDANAAHLSSQGDEDEVEDVLRKPGEDRSGREGARIAVGRTRAGRYVRVIYVSDQERDSIFVITAYELSGKPLRAYRRRRRKKQS